VKYQLIVAPAAVAVLALAGCSKGTEAGRWASESWKNSPESHEHFCSIWTEDGEWSMRAFLWKIGVEDEEREDAYIELLRQEC